MTTNNSQKQCPKCKDRFKHKQGVYCLPCRREYETKGRRKKGIRPLSTKTTKYECRWCHTTEPERFYHSDKYKSMDTICKICQRDYRKARAEHYRRYNRTWMAKYTAEEKIKLNKRRQQSYWLAPQKHRMRCTKWRQQPQNRRLLRLDQYSRLTFGVSSKTLTKQNMEILIYLRAFRLVDKNKITKGKAREFIDMFNSNPLEALLSIHEISIREHKGV